MAKTGLLCCVAARPYGSNAISGDWSMGPHEPYWQTNTSFSPPPSRWDIQFQSEGLPYDSYDGIQLYRSTTSNSKESKSWVGGNLLCNHQYSASDGAGPFLSSPSDLFQGPQWTPPQQFRKSLLMIMKLQQGELADQYLPGILFLAGFKSFKGTLAIVDNRGSTSSGSDSSEPEPRVKSCISSDCNLTSHLSYMFRPIYPLSFPTQMPAKEASDSKSTVLSDCDSSAPQGEPHCWSSASSNVDFADVSEPLESESYGRSCTSLNTFKCALCKRFLLQRSPWSSCQIVRSGDMPIVGVLSRRHVFHAECLEQTTPKAHKSDPPCPLCLRLQEENSPDQQVCSRMGNGFPRLRLSCEDGQSRPWGCAQVGGCVEGALHVPPRNTILLINQNHVTKNLCLEGNSSKDFPGKLKENWLIAFPAFQWKSIGSRSSRLFKGNRRP